MLQETKHLEERIAWTKSEIDGLRKNLEDMGSGEDPVSARYSPCSPLMSARTNTVGLRGRPVVLLTERGREIREDAGARRANDRLYG